MESWSSSSRTLRKQRTAAENRRGRPFEQQARIDALTKRKLEIEDTLTLKEDA